MVALRPALNALAWTVASTCLIALVATRLTGCERAGDVSPTDTANIGSEPTARADPATDLTPQPDRLDACRIASLSPAMTQVLVDLGLGEQIVGRTPFCDSVPSEVPIVGSLLDVDYERLLAARPTHLVVQPAAGGTDPELERLAAVHRWVLIEQQLDRLEDVERFVADLPSAMAPNATLAATPEFAAFRGGCEALAAEVHALRLPAVNAAPLATLILVGTEPLTAAGADTFVSEMVHAAGAKNAIATPGYPELSFEDLITLNPEAILVLRETALDAGEEARLLAPLRSSATDAARNGRVLVHVDPQSMLPSTTAPKVVVRLAERLAGLAGRKAGES